MVKIACEKLEPGMIIAKSVETRRGQFIADAGTVLDRRLIARLTFYNISDVMITDETARITNPTSGVQLDVEEIVNKLDDILHADDSVSTTDSSPEVHEHTAPRHTERMSYSSKVQSSPKFQRFQMDFTKNMISLQHYFQEICDGNADTGLAKDLLRETAELFSSKTPLEIFDMVHNMRSVEDTIYAHSLNVALIARAIGKWLKYSRDDLNLLTVAGLLHDIGKTRIPDDILYKHGRLSDDEFNLIKSHALEGYKILKETRLDTRIKLAALQHHERFDGSGYPRGLSGDEIDGFASIIAISDVYDAMTAARSYRSPMCAFQVISEFEKSGFQKYNPKVIYTFLNHVAGCYINSRILLSDGESGTVVFLNNGSLSRPVIKLDSDEMIDLSNAENKELYISNIL